MTEQHHVPPPTPPVTPAAPAQPVQPVTNAQQFQPDGNAPAPQAAAPRPAAHAPQAAEPRKPKPLPATIKRIPGQQFGVTLDGVARRNTPSIPAAITDLCGEAIRRGCHIIVTISTPESRKYMAIDPAGQVRESTPPAPDTARLDPEELRTRIGDKKNLGEGQQTSDSTINWVEEKLLAGGATQKKKRGLFRRRR